MRAPTSPARYSIHGVVTIDSQIPMMELEPFRDSDAKGEALISVEVGDPLAQREGQVWSETLGRRGAAVALTHRDGRLQTVVSWLLGRSPHVLYNNVVEPILRFELLRLGHALVHAACVVRGDEALLITARTDTGKTSTMLQILEAGGLGFLSDDMCILAPSGEVLMFPKPMTISAHTLSALELPRLERRERARLVLQSRIHSRGGRRAGFALARSRLPAASMSATLQILVPPPKYDVSRLVPGVRNVHRGRPSRLFVIERGAAATQTVPPEEMLDLLVSNTDDAYGFPPYAAIESYLRHRDGYDLKQKERSLMDDLLARKGGVRLRSDSFDWADRILDLIGTDAA